MAKRVAVQQEGIGMPESGPKVSINYQPIISNETTQKSTVLTKHNLKTTTTSVEIVSGSGAPVLDFKKISELKRTADWSPEDSKTTFLFYLMTLY